MTSQTSYMVALVTGNRIVRISGVPFGPIRLVPSASTTWTWAPSQLAWRDLTHTGTLSEDHRAALRLASTWTIHQAAAVVDAADALRLEIAPGRPVLMVDSVDADGDGRPVLTTRARFAADRIELMIET